MEAGLKAGNSRPKYLAQLEQAGIPVEPNPVSPVSQRSLLFMVKALTYTDERPTARPHQLGTARLVTAEPTETDLAWRVYKLANPN